MMMIDLFLVSGDAVLFLSELCSLVFISLISASLNCSSHLRDWTCTGTNMSLSCYSGEGCGFTVYGCFSSSPSCWAPSPCHSALSVSESPAASGSLSASPSPAELISENPAGHGSPRSSTLFHPQPPSADDTKTHTHSVLQHLFSAGTSPS